MVNRNQESVSFSKDEKKRIKTIADASGETFSGYIRRQIMMIVKEEEAQS